MANTFKKVIDRQMWVQTTPNIGAHAAGTSLASDLRNNTTRNPFVYFLGGNSILRRFNIVQKSWQTLASPVLGGTFGAGSTSWFAPSFGAVGTIAAGATTTSVVISTALPGAVGTNMLANRGGSGDLGYRIRIIDTTAGKTEERWITANTSGTTPTITVDAAFTFTPASGARYELLAGRLFMLGASTLAASTVRTLEVATNTYADRSNTNLPASITTDSSALCLDEQYVPYNNRPGEGMLKGATVYDTASSLNALTATAAAASTLTGQATSGDAVVAANEYRNFQIRIVQDTTTPASVGQRRVILHHTAGPSPVYTLGAAWTTTPSATARYVIELPNLVLLRSTATTATYVYNYADAAYTGNVTIAANAWNATWVAAGQTHAVGNVWAPSFGIQPDAARNARHAFCYNFRGAAGFALDVLDFSGGTGSPTSGVPPLWTAGITYDGGTDTFGTGTAAAPSPFGNEGRYTYINCYVASQLSQMYRFDAQNRVLSPHVATDFIQTGTATVGGRMAAYAAIDGTDLYDVVLLQSHLSQLTQELIPLV
jgi:hypothetical protein